MTVQWIPSCEDALDQQSSRLLKLDRAAVVDIEFIRALATVAGEKKILKEALKEFPSKERSVTMSATLAGLRGLQNSVLCRFCSQSCQERLSCTQKWVVSLQEGCHPTLPVNANAWLREVWDALAYYARVLVEQDVGITDGECKKETKIEKVWVYGAEALAASWTQMAKRKPADIALNELDLYAGLRHLLTRELQEQVDKKKAEVLKLQKPGMRRATCARPGLFDAPARAEKRRKVAASKEVAKGAADSLFS